MVSYIQWLFYVLFFFCKHVLLVIKDVLYYIMMYVCNYR